MNNERILKEGYENNGFQPNENLGQHILIDEAVINTVVNQIDRGASVIEIGAGPGNFTEKIAEKATRVVAVEIDQRYKPFLDAIQEKNPNVSVLYQDAIALNLKKIISSGKQSDEWQIASNLPFHISEPFLKKLIDIPIESAVLVVGDKLARKMQIEDPDSLEFSRLSLLIHTFFEPSLLTYIDRKSFYPQPRTDAAMVILNPREKKEFEKNTGSAILRNLFLSESDNPSVIKVINNSYKGVGNSSLMSKTESHRYDRRQTKQELKQMSRSLQYGYNQPEFQRDFGGKESEKLGLPNELLSKPFSRFDNQDIRILTMALRERYGQV